MNRVVNLKISTKGRYALRLMVDLAQCKQGENVALKEKRIIAQTVWKVVNTKSLTTS